MADPSRANRDQDLRQALAIAIVQQKRGLRNELHELRQELQQQREAAAELRRAATRLAARQEPTAGRASGGRPRDAPLPPGWLPPLSLAAAPATLDLGGACAPDLGPLAHQLAAAARAEPASDALAGKARALSGMLLANVRLLRALRQEPGAAAAGGGGVGGGGGPEGAAVGPAAEVAEFVAGTLLHTPVSSLSHAYLQESAAALAACLSPPPAPPPQQGPGGRGGAREAAPGAPAAARAGRAEDAAGGCGSGAALSVVGDLIERLFEAAFPTGAQQDQQQDAASASQARCALHALARLPPTGAALLRGAARHLRRACGAAARAQQAVLAAGAGGGCPSEAMELGAALFESSHELLELFEALCTEQLPAWAPALSSCAAGPAAAGAGAGLLQQLIADTVDALLGAHALLPALEGAYPLMAEGAAGAVGHLAAALQHVASAPGLCVGGGGPALRGAAARQCVRLRDALMPAA